MSDTIHEQVYGLDRRGWLADLWSKPLDIAEYLLYMPKVHPHVLDIGIDEKWIIAPPANATWNCTLCGRQLPLNKLCTCYLPVP